MIDQSVRSPKHVNKWHFCVPNALRANKTRARSGTREKLSNAQNGLKRTLLSPLVNLSILKFWRARARASSGTRGYWWMAFVTYDLKFTSTESDEFRMCGYGDISDDENSQNGVWRSSRLSDHTPKVSISIPDQGQAMVKISCWSDIPILRFLMNKY